MLIWRTSLLSSGLFGSQVQGSFEKLVAGKKVALGGQSEDIGEATWVFMMGLSTPTLRLRDGLCLGTGDLLCSCHCLPLCSLCASALAHSSAWLTAVFLSLPCARQALLRVLPETAPSSSLLSPLTSQSPRSSSTCPHWTCP